MAFDIPNMVDLAALIFAIFLMAKGLVRGFTGELFGFLGSVGGFILLWKYAPALAGMLKYKLGFSDIVAYIIAIAAIFITANIAASLLGKLAKKIIYFGHLSMLDKLMGGLCGLIKVLIVLIVVYLALEFIAKHTGATSMSWMDKSKAMTISSNLWNYVSSWLLEKGIIDHIALPNITIKVHV